MQRLKPLYFYVSHTGGCPADPFWSKFKNYYDISYVQDNKATNGVFEGVECKLDHLKQLKNVLYT